MDEPKVMGVRVSESLENLREIHANRTRKIPLNVRRLVRENNKNDISVELLKHNVTDFEIDFKDMLNQTTASMNVDGIVVAVGMDSNYPFSSPYVLEAHAYDATKRGMIDKIKWWPSRFLYDYLLTVVRILRDDSAENE